MATVLTCYYRPKPGGLCTRLFRAIRALLDRGHTVHYLSLAPFPIDHPRCRFHRFPWPVGRSDSLLFWALFHLLAPPMLLGLALRHRIGCTFAFGSTYAFLMRPIYWAMRIRPTYFLRGDPILSHGLQGRAGWIVRLDQWIEGVALQDAMIVGVSAHLTHALLGRHPGRRPRAIHVLPNDLPISQADHPSAPTGPLRLAVAGILEPMKNHAFILTLLPGLETYPWHFYLYGQGPEAARLAAIVDCSGLGGRIFFRGWVPRENIWPAVDLLLSPSLHEGMPNAVLEAVAAGVPVLASDIPAHREILPADQLLPLDDPDRWRRALVNLLEAPADTLPAMARRQLRASARLCFDWDQHIVDLIVPPRP